MDISERIHHIIDIAKALAREDWSVVDLTLKQFQLPTSDNWGGDGESYIMEMLDGASDGTLLSIAKHLGTASELETISPPGFWKENDTRIFISHVSSVKAKAGTLRDELATHGLKGFVAHDDIEPTLE